MARPNQHTRKKELFGTKVRTQAALLPLGIAARKGLNAVAKVKFFTPDHVWTWYASGFAGHDLFYGLVAGIELELGPFLLSVLEAVRGPSGLRIERDRYFIPQTLLTLQEFHEHFRR